MTKRELRSLLHGVVTDLTVAFQHTELASKDLKTTDAADAPGNIRHLVLAERAVDIAAAIRRLIDDIRKA